MGRCCFQLFRESASVCVPTTPTAGGGSTKTAPKRPFIPAAPTRATRCVQRFQVRTKPPSKRAPSGRAALKTFKPEYLALNKAYGYKTHRQSNDPVEPDHAPPTPRAFLGRKSTPLGIAAWVSSEPLLEPYHCQVINCRS